MTTSDEQGRLIDELTRENQALRAELAALRVTEDRFRTLFECSNDAHLLVGESGILDCNEAAIRMLRCKDKREVLALHPVVLSPEFQPDGQSSRDRGLELEAIARANGFHRFEWTHRRMDGEAFPVEVLLSPVRLVTGPAMLAVWHDLTPFKRAEEALREQMAIVEAQAREIRALSTPILEVWESVLLVPLLGVLDEARTNALEETLLASIALRGARHVILDLTGIASMDAEAARRLVSLVAGAELLGSRGIFVGIRRDVAAAIVETGIDLGRAKTLPNVRAALSFCARG